VDFSGAHGLSPSAASTRQRLLDSAIGLIGEAGHVPQISAVARAAGVSRATAYRYFPSRSTLIGAVVDFSLGRVRRFESELDSAEARLDELFGTTFTRFAEFEPQMRAALQLSLEHAALEKAGNLGEAPYRRGYRVAILRKTFAPLKPTMPPRSFDRLCKAMSLLFGIEPYVVLKDIWGCDNEEIGHIAFWMARGLLACAQSEAGNVVPAETKPEVKKARKLMQPRAVRSPA
jgi:AcrR family transcriptional regulator